MKLSSIWHVEQRVNYSPQYQASIDGIRSLAVMAVFLFHLDRNLLPGGFVGVDVFFVISGFLITRILVSRLDKKDYFLQFYQRRIARIVPEMVAVLVFVNISCYYIMSQREFSVLGGNIVAAITSTINVKLSFEGNYFRASPDSNPLLHYWSLAVEEQFYLVFPTIILVSSRLFKTLLYPVAFLFVISFATCVFLTPREPVFAFYMLPTRAWELLAGSLLAILEFRGVTLRAAAAKGAAALGVIVFLIATIFINDDSHFPGWLAAIPVASSVLMLASANSSGITTRILAHSIPVFIGKRSYSLYLWHWPMFSLVDYEYFSMPGFWRGCLKILLPIVATLITYRYIEQPLRRTLNIRKNLGVAFAGFFATMAVISFIGYEIHGRYYYNAAPRQIAAGGVEINSSGDGSVVLVGDSLAAMYGETLASLAQSDGFKLNVISAAGHNELFGEDATLWPNVERFLVEHKADVIIVGEFWDWKFGDDAEKLRGAVSAVSKLADHVILLLQPPYAPIQGVREAIRDGAKLPLFESRQNLEARASAKRIILGAAPKGVDVIDVASALLNSDGSIRAISREGRANYEDGQHLTDAGVDLVRPLLERSIKKALSKNVSPDETSK